MGSTSATVGPKEILGGPAAHALLTTAGNPICTAVGRSVLRVLQHEELPERAAQAGLYFIQLLREDHAHEHRRSRVSPSPAHAEVE